MFFYTVSETLQKKGWGLIMPFTIFDTHCGPSSRMEDTVSHLNTEVGVIHPGSSIVGVQSQYLLP